MEIVIISGGNIQEDFALDFLYKHKKAMKIAADRGMELCQKAGIIPEHIIGDLDSVDSGTLSYYEGQKGICWHRLKPEKDDTDTQSALNLAIDLKAEKVWILGGTGTRMDHVLANINLLVYGARKNTEVILVDAHNQITLLKKETRISKNQQFGRYVSFFGWGENIEGLTLEGFKYPLTKAFLRPEDCGLTVSNEIVEEEAKVSYEKGSLIMVMSRD